MTRGRAARGGHARIAEAREVTNEKLRRERKRVDRAVGQKLAQPALETQRSIARARTEVDRKLDEAEETARDQVEREPPTAPTVEHGVREQVAQVKRVERSKAKAAVEVVAERADRALEEERKHVDAVTDEERADRKHAFLAILGQERHDTDRALTGERSQSDERVTTRDQVLAMISHDLRNVIQAIGWKAHLLGKELRDEQALAKRFAAEIESSCKVMVRWANDLVDIATLDTGVLQLHEQTCSATDLIEEAVQAFRAKATSKDIRFRTLLPDGAPAIDCDHDRVIQVMTNLLDNATKFTPAGGTIEASCETTDEGTIFSVTDSGPGVREDDRAHVFEQRWHTSGLRGGGAGLGLHICKRVVEAHGGRIWLESPPEGGSRFRFLLPLRRPRSDDHAAPPLASAR